MIIGIDANEANIQKRVGISEFAYQIIQKFYEFRKSTKINHDFVIYLKSKPIDEMPKEKSWWKYKIVGPKKLWTQVGLPLNLITSKAKLDVFFSTTHYSPRFSKFPTVVSVMDLSYLRFPETFRKNDLYQLKNWTKYSVEKAKKIITISQSSKDDIIKYYKVKAQDVVVVHLGLKEIKGTMNSSKEVSEFGIEGKFILFVGTIQPRKNILRLMEAYSKLPEDIKNDYQLVIIGKKGWLYDEIVGAPEKMNLAKRILFLEYIKDEDLPLFYRKASLFALPSLYEGFGLPVLEAMRYDCPVVTSNVSSLPEAGGDAALYFDPENTEEISKTIEKVLTDDKLRKEMIEKGRVHYKKFTWEKTAESVLETLEETVNN